MRPSRIKPIRMAKKKGFRRLKAGLSQTSTGRPHSQPLEAKQLVRIAQPEKISQKTLVLAERIESIMDVIDKEGRVLKCRYCARVLDVKVVGQPDRNLIEVTVTFKVVNTNEVVVFTTTLSRLR